MSFEWLVAFALPALLTTLSTPLAIRLAHRIGAIDLPNKRKAHDKPMPRLGGVAVFGSFALSVLLFRVSGLGVQLPNWIDGWEGMLLALAGIAMLALGIRDDVTPLKPSIKFIGQLVMYSGLYWSGLRIDGVTYLFGSGVVELGIFNYLLTVIWLVGVTNAINLIDGLDGLAAGVSAIAALTMAAVAGLQGDPGTALLALILAGAISGFLRYNFHPAKTFLGDSGSLFIGFALAVLSTRSYTKSSTAFSLLVPVLALGLPIMDTLLSMIRRLADSFLQGPDKESNPKVLNRLMGIFRPDARHIHHRLIALGLSQRNAVIVLYVVSCALGIAAFLTTVINNVAASMILVGILAASVIGVKMLQYREMAVLRNGMLLQLFDQRIMDHRLFQAFLDTAFIMVAYAGAHVLTNWNLDDGSTERGLAVPLLVVCAVQFTAFLTMGCYRRTVHQFALVDALVLTRAAAVGALLTGLVFYALPGFSFHRHVSTLTLDFYFLLTFSLGSRISFRTLKYMFEVNALQGRGVVIYGADAPGVFVLQRILDNQFQNLKPVGFLDDRPHLKGKDIQGFPVFGDYRELERVARTHHIDEVLISMSAPDPDVLEDLQQSAEALGLTVRVFQARLASPHPLAPLSRTLNRRPAASPVQKRAQEADAPGSLVGETTHTSA
jgi:UDP-GlcNAc:undecaprenyl-phosphate/decaprenyl-phosphate GlcNAc-1-phosphate transferase